MAQGRQFSESEIGTLQVQIIHLECSEFILTLSLVHRWCFAMIQVLLH
eukprot:SAG11_NODE_1395_length_5038_cov_1.168050_5_plen_48_part_00